MDQDTINENLRYQAEELQNLSDWFPKHEVEVISKNEIKFDFSKKFAHSPLTVFVDLPLGYPSQTTLNFDIKAPVLTLKEKTEVTRRLKDAKSQFFGGEDQIFKTVYEFWQFLSEKFDPPRRLIPGVKFLIPRVQDQRKLRMDANNNVIPPKIKIISTATVGEHKSIFQGHCAAVNSKEDVAEVLDEIKANGKVKKAKHNMFIYAFKDEATGKIVSKVDNDGEKEAEDVLQKVFDNNGAENCIIVVTRWFGGIQIGASRFKHIHSVATQALVDAGFNNTKAKGKEEEHSPKTGKKVAKKNKFSKRN